MRLAYVQTNCCKKNNKERLQNPTLFALTLTITKGSIFFKLCFVLIFMYMYDTQNFPEKNIVSSSIIYTIPKDSFFLSFTVVYASIILLISILNHSININDVRMKRMLEYSIHFYAHHILLVYIRTSLT